MQFKRLKRKFRYPLSFLCYIIAFFIIYKLILFSIPFVADKLQPITVLSAGVSFLDGGIALINSDDIAPVAQDAKIDKKDNFFVPITDDSGFNDEEPPETPPPTEDSTPPPTTKPENSGTVVYNKFSAGSSPQFIPLSSGFVRNLAGLPRDEVIGLSNTPLGFNVEKNGEPQVLIYHTHATESYQPIEADWYDLTYNARSKDNAKNMIAVGAAMTKKLNDAGIVTIHDTTQHDNPSYTGAYDNSRKTIEKYLAEYPSIKVVLDVHRDAIQKDTTITAPVTTINGVKTAQIMIISCADNGSGRIPNYKQNLTFATALQSQMESDYPTLTRPILFDTRFYNQDLSTGALLLEMGGHANTLEQSLNAADLLSNSLIKVLS